MLTVCRSSWVSEWLLFGEDNVPWDLARSIWTRLDIAPIVFKALVFVVGNKRRIARRKTLLPLWEAWFRLGIVFNRRMPRWITPKQRGIRCQLAFLRLGEPRYTLFPLVEPPRRCKLSFRIQAGLQSLLTPRRPQIVIVGKLMFRQLIENYAFTIHWVFWKLPRKNLQTGSIKISISRTCIFMQNIF